MIVRRAETVAERARGREEATKEQLCSRLSIPEKSERKKTERSPRSRPAAASHKLPEVTTKTSAARYVTRSPSIPLLFSIRRTSSIQAPGVK